MKRKSGDGAPEQEIEITPEMIEAGVDAIFSEPGIAPLGVTFSAHDLAISVYRAMFSSRPQKAKST